jgi:hypothetical protein
MTAIRPVEVFPVGAGTGIDRLKPTVLAGIIPTLACPELPSDVTFPGPTPCPSP